MLDGYDEALLLDVHGFVAEGAGENLFVVKDGELYEPEPTSTLPGVTLDTVHTLARDAGAVMHTRRLTRDDVYLADEAFFCGTAAELTPNIELDRRRIGAGEPGAVTQKLMADFGAAARGKIRGVAHACVASPPLPD